MNLENGNVISNKNAISIPSLYIDEEPNSDNPQHPHQHQHLESQQPQQRQQQRQQSNKRSGVTAMAEGVQRKVSSVDQMAQLKSYYNVKSVGSQDDSDVFMEEVERRKSVINTLFLPMVVSSGFVSSTANEVSDRIVRSISVPFIIFLSRRVRREIGIV